MVQTIHTTLSASIRDSSGDSSSSESVNEIISRKDAKGKRGSSCHQVCILFFI